MGAPDFVGHMGDADGWFRYPAGRSADTSTRGPSRSRSTTRRARRLPTARPHLAGNACQPRNERPRSERGMLDGHARRRRLEWISDDDQTATCAGWSRLTPTQPPPPPPPARQARRPASGATRPDPHRRPRPADRCVLRRRKAGTNLPPGRTRPGPRSLGHAQLPPDRAGRRREDLGRDIEHPVWRLTLRAASTRSSATCTRRSRAASPSRRTRRRCPSEGPRDRQGAVESEALDPRRALLGRPRPLPGSKRDEGAHHASPGCRPHVAVGPGWTWSSAAAPGNGVNPVRGIPAAPGAD